MDRQGGNSQRQDGAAGVRADPIGLTQEEIYAAIRAGKLQYREASMHGNPWLRLLRREVEALVKRKHGSNYLKGPQAKTELGEDQY